MQTPVILNHPPLCYYEEESIHKNQNHFMQQPVNMLSNVVCLAILTWEPYRDLFLKPASSGH